MSDSENQETTNNKTAMVPARQRRSLAMRGGQVQIESFDDLQRFCQHICYSGMVPKQYDANKMDPRQAIGAAMVAIMHGAELGMSPLSSLQNIASINGKPSLYGDGFWARIVGHPEYEDHKETFDEAKFEWTCSIKRRGKEWKSYSFSRADAEKAKLWGKSGPWSDYPKRQCQWRARGFCGRDVFPDAFGGVWLEHEARDIVDQQPEWVDHDGAPREGVHSFNGGKPQPHQLPAAAPAPAVVEHPAAAPVEAKPEPAPQQQAAPKAEPKPAAKPKPETKQEASGQMGVKW